MTNVTLDLYWARLHSTNPTPPTAPQPSHPPKDTQAAPLTQARLRDTLRTVQSFESSAGSSRFGTRHASVHADLRVASRVNSCTPPSIPMPMPIRLLRDHPIMATSLVPVLAGLVALLIPYATLAAASDRLNLLPLPTEYTVGDTVVCLHPNFEVKFDSHAPDDLVAAADHMVQRIQKSKHRYLSPSYGAEFFVKRGCETFIDSLFISVRDKGSIFEEAVKPVEGRTGREAYELKVPVEGEARASAHTALGGFRALTTFENLWFKADLSRGGSGLRGSVHQTALTAHPRAKATYAPFAPYDIKDQPAFPWRAVLLDTSRHYFVMDSIEKMLDTMASVKLNVFHWYVRAASLAYTEAHHRLELVASRAREPPTASGERGVW